MIKKTKRNKSNILDLLDTEGLCNKATALKVAQRILNKYGNQEGIINDQSVENMMKDAYQTINCQFQPEEQDITMYKEIMDINGDKIITIDDIQQMTNRFLIGDNFGGKSFANKKAELNLQDNQEFQFSDGTLQLFNDAANEIFERYQIDEVVQIDDLSQMIWEVYNLRNKKFYPMDKNIDLFIKNTNTFQNGSGDSSDFKKVIFYSLQKTQTS